MAQFYIEGAFVTRLGLKKKRKTGAYPTGSIEPYAKTIWAESSQAALQIATAELDGGEWTDGPHISQVTEEQRMRSAHQPEFPGLTPRKTTKHSQ